jgi:hypothetical protein
VRTLSPRGQHGDPVDVTPAPLLISLERTDDRMIAGIGVDGGVAFWGLRATHSGSWAIFTCARCAQSAIRNHGARKRDRAHRANARRFAASADGLKKASREPRPAESVRLVS